MPPQLPRHEFEQQVSIAAPPERVWQAFADFKSYPQWTRYLQFKADSAADLKEGQPFDVTIGAEKGAALRPTVLVNSPGRELRWRGQLFNTNLLFSGEHYFTVSNQQPAAGQRGGNKAGTTFTQGEKFEGLLVPLLQGLLAKSKEEQADFNSGLKARVEGAGKR